jgi:hypothetical protein
MEDLWLILQMLLRILVKNMDYSAAEKEKRLMLQ